MRGNEMKKNNKGFSLVELIVVIAVMAVLVVVLAPAYLRYVDKARLQKDVSAIGEVIQSIKVTAAEEDAIDAIPTQDVSDRLKITTKVLIAEETGAVSAKSLMENSDYFVSEVAATIGSNVVFKSEDFVKYGVELKVTRDDDYKIYIAIEDFEYSDTTKDALKQLGLQTYQSTTKKAEKIQENWTKKAQTAYDTAYWAKYDSALAEAEKNPKVLKEWNWSTMSYDTITKEEYAAGKASTAGKWAANSSITEDVFSKSQGLEDDAKVVFIDSVIEESGGGNAEEAIKNALTWQSTTVNGMTPTPRESESE